MQIRTEIGQRWKKALGASLTIALLSAVAVVGLTLFVSQISAAWKTPGEAEQALASGSAFDGLLNFKAPAETVARFKTEKDATLVKNWKYTQNSFLDNIANIYIEGIQLQLIADFLEKFFPNSPITAFVVTFENAWLATADGFLAVLRLPPIPPISPSF